MGVLLEKIGLKNTTYGNGLVEKFKDNSLYIYDKLKKSEDDLINIKFGDISVGGFYFFHYKDDSNWMKYSPVFVIDFRKFENYIIIIAVNFNFIPLEIRSFLFDKYITKEDIDKNRDLKVDYKSMYNELKRLGFEYSIIEYNLSQMLFVHKVSMSIIDKFIYSQHPINKYDPKKLYEICISKLKDQDRRDQEIKKLYIDELYDISKDITNQFEMLKGRIDRIQKSLEKYG